MSQQIEVTFDRRRPALAEELRDYAERRLTFALRRFREQIRRVRLRFVDVNGPRHGVDTRCLMIAELTNGQRLVVEATTAWPQASVTRAANWLNVLLRRTLARGRAFG